MAHRIVTTWLVMLLLGATPVRGASFRSGQPVMGTILNVTIEAADAATARALAEAAIGAARHWDDVLTTWRQEGELARLNARAGKGMVPISSDLHQSLTQMVSLSRLTHGAFDPAVEPWVELWRNPTTPAPSGLQAGHGRIAAVLRLEPGHAALQSDAALNAGAIGKGMALDAIWELVRSGGAQAAFVDFGGSSQLAFSTAAVDVAPWEIVVAGYAAGSVRGRVRLRNGCLSTSRASGKGDEAGPIIDPSQGRPVTARRSVTVIAPSNTAADAWSTALVVLGRSGIPLARRAGVEVLLEDGEGVEQTENFPLESS